MSFREPADRSLLLEIRDLHTYFATPDGPAKAVNGINFAVANDETVGIVGESGSGKSVASLTIMRLIQSPGYSPHGQIMFRGRDLLQASDDEMHHVRGIDIAMVFQEPMTALNPVYSVGAQIVEAIRAHGRVNRAQARTRAIELLDQVGIPAPGRRFDDYPHTMSGGMRQRIMIAMAIANSPQLLILDEPTTALDVTVQAQILELIRSLRERVGASILLITHDIGVIAEMCDRVVVMYGGKIMESGTVMQVLKKPEHPYTQGLLNSVPRIGRRGQRLNVIQGSVTSPLDLPSGCPFAERCPHVMNVCSRMPSEITLGDGRKVMCWLHQNREPVAATSGS